MTRQRYFDEKLGAWVTVLPSGQAAGAHTVDAMRPFKAAGWRAGKAAAKARHPNLNQPRRGSVRPATDADLPSPPVPKGDRSLMARVRRAEDYVRGRQVVTAIEIGTAAIEGEGHPLGKKARQEIGKGIANLLELRGRLHKRPDGRYLVRKGRLPEVRGGLYL